jgi:Asp-tRNA(Asn)/Glu-tRNA(Gln) amidotransferase A subunit family amidase
MGIDTTLSRKEFLGAAGAGALVPLLGGFSGSILGGAPLIQDDGEITEADLKIIEKLGSFSFTAEERKAALNSVKEFRGEYESIRTSGVPYETMPAVHFVPTGKRAGRFPWESVGPDKVRLPDTDEDIAHLTVAELAPLVRDGDLSPVRLTRICLDRLKKYGPHLLCVITLLEDEAMAEAKAAENEIRAGKYRGPLHGIPTGVKDLFAYTGHPTTWGAEPFVDRELDYDSAVVLKLRDAGAIICAKLSLGALAMNDHWHKGRTRNPWNPAQGSSGSSAGSGSAMAAGLLPFTIGTETLGSIVSPSHRCRVTGLRPTYGAVSRHGAMALSWTMDKAGPICRTAQDAMIVLAAIEGGDPRDPGTQWARPRYESPDDYVGRCGSAKKAKVGYLAGDGDKDYLKPLREAGFDLQPVEISPPDGALLTGLSIESSAAFESITLSGEVNTIKNSLWPGIFRAQRYHLSVDYVQTLRARSILMRDFEEQLGDFDVIAAPGRGSHLLLSTNLTGHPQLYLPQGEKDGSPLGLSLIGRLYGEPALCAVGQSVQELMQIHRRRPDFAAILANDPTPR